MTDKSELALMLQRAADKPGCRCANGKTIWKVTQQNDSLTYVEPDQAAMTKRELRRKRARNGAALSKAMRGRRY